MTRQTLGRFALAVALFVMANSPVVACTVFDLTQGEVYVHHRRDFDRTVKINLKEGLGKGERVLKIASLFQADGELRRRAMFGAELAPVTREVRDRQKLDGDGGVLLVKIFPGTSAADAEFKAGDVITTLDASKVTGVPAFLDKIADARAGDVLTLEVVRDGAKTERRVTLTEKPREKDDVYDVIYASVKSRGARLRTIVTRPKTAGRHPAVMLLQGYGCFSIDYPIGSPSSFTRIARDLAGHGYATLRLDRPGSGDSEGGPCQDVDFETELDGYRQALRALKEFDFVDADNVFLFGHSLGGAMAGFLAAEMPVRGIAVYGTSADTWLEGILGQRRRIASLDGTDPAEVDRKILREARFWYPLLVEKKTPREILEGNPELRKGFGTASGNNWMPMVREDKYVAGRHYTFHHQTSDKNLAEALAKVAGTRLSVDKAPAEAAGEELHPRVLALWGKSDWQVDRAETAWIAEIVNRVKPGAGSFVELESIDHVFLRAATPGESYRFFNPAKAAAPAEFNPVILETLRAWLNETAGKA